MPYKLIIADDELPIRKALSEFYDWGKHDIEVVATCRNGLEALEAILDECPDIVLTDIQMPGLSGLELIHRLRNVDNEAEFIILSGYRDFSYAQQAMSEGITHYLTKPLDEDELWRAIEQCKKARIRSIPASRDQRTYGNKQTTLKQSLSILLTPGMTPNQFAHLVEINAPILEYIYTMMCIVLYPTEDVKVLQSKIAFHLHAKDACLVLPLIVIDSCAFIVARLKVNEIEQDSTNDFVQELLSAYNPPLHMQTYITNHDLAVCINPLLDKIRQAKFIYIYDQNETPHTIHLSTASWQFVNDICHDLGHVSEVEARLLMENFFSITGKKGEYCKLACAMLLSLLFSCNRLSSAAVGSLFVTTCHMDTAVEGSSIFIDALIQALYQADTTYSSEPIRQVQQYLTEHISDSSLSLRKIAKEVCFMNVDYLSHLFVAETGIKFSKYLNELRVRKAKELLLKGDMNVNEIAECVGCGGNPRYFSQVFKRYTGLTPTAFINQK